MFPSPSASLNGGESQVNFPDTETRSFSFKWEAATCAKSSLKTMGTLKVKTTWTSEYSNGHEKRKQTCQKVRLVTLLQKQQKRYLWWSSVHFRLQILLVFRLPHSNNGYKLWITKCKGILCLILQHKMRETICGNQAGPKFGSQYYFFLTDNKSTINLVSRLGTTKNKTCNIWG